MAANYDNNWLIFQNKKRARKGIGNNSTKVSDDNDTNEEYQAFLRKYEELTKE